MLVKCVKFHVHHLLFLHSIGPGHPSWPYTFSASPASLSATIAIASLSLAVFTLFSWFLISSSVTRHCLQRSCGVPEPAPGMVCDKSEDHRVAMGWVSTTCIPLVGTHLGNVVSARLWLDPDLINFPALLQAWSPCSLFSASIVVGLSKAFLPGITSDLKGMGCDSSHWSLTYNWTPQRIEMFKPGFGLDSFPQSQCFLVKSSPSYFSSLYPMKINHEIGSKWCRNLPSRTHYFGSLYAQSLFVPARVRLNIIKQIWVKNRKLKVKPAVIPAHSSFTSL